MNRQFRFSVLIMAALLLTACAPPMYHATNQQITEVQQNTQKADKRYQQMTKKRSVSKPVVHKQPRWLRQHVTIHGRNLPFSFVVNKILKDTGVFVSFDSTVNKNKKLSMDFHGQVGAALKDVAAQTNYAYSLSNDTMSWSAFQTKTFDISFMPGTSSYMVGKSNQSSTTSTIAGSTATSESNQFSNLHGALSVWDDLHQTLNQLKSKQGDVSVSEATTSVTVHDHPENVVAITHYINQLNQSLSREVALSVQVLNISLNRGFNYGINWKLLYKDMNLAYGGAGGLAQPVALQTLGNNMSALTGPGSAAGFVLRATDGKWAGTDMFLNALSQQGRVSTVTRPRVVTLNNQVAEIDINTQQSYLKQVSTTTVGAASASETSLTPGTVKTGFTLYILPKVKGKQVYLQISSVISRLLNIATISANPNSSATNNNQIQLPTVNEKRFNQRSLVPSGSTLVLAGFKQTHNETGSTKVLDQAALGGRGASQENEETIVLITPTILHG